MKIMAVDLGDARTGIAVCDRSEFLASPLTVIWEKNRDRLLDKIEQEVLREKPEQVIVGNPINLDGYLNETDVRGKKRKAVVDAVAAVIILENYLAYRKNNPQDTGGFLEKKK